MTNQELEDARRWKRDVSLSAARWSGMHFAQHDKHWVVREGCYERTIVPAKGEAESGGMAKYSSLLGRRVQIQYRTGEVNLPASGMLSADSGRSIFLEERFEKSGSVRSFRWEIPYQYIVRIVEVDAEVRAEGLGVREKDSGIGI